MAMRTSFFEGIKYVCEPFSPLCRAKRASLLVGKKFAFSQLYAAKRASLPPTNLKFGFHLPLLLSGKTNKDLRRSLIK